MSLAVRPVGAVGGWVSALAVAKPPVNARELIHSARHKPNRNECLKDVIRMPVHFFQERYGNMNIF